MARRLGSSENITELLAFGEIEPWGNECWLLATLCEFFYNANRSEQSEYLKANQFLGIDSPEEIPGEDDGEPGELSQEELAAEDMKFAAFYTALKIPPKKTA